MEYVEGEMDEGAGGVWVCEEEEEGVTGEENMLRYPHIVISSYPQIFFHLTFSYPNTSSYIISSHPHYGCH